MKNLLLQFAIYFGFFGLCLSCTSNNSNSQQGLDNVKMQNSKVNAEGFGGVNAEGFGGIIKPIVNTLFVPFEVNIPKGKLLSLIGENFLEGIKIEISNVACTNVKLANSNSLTCELSEQIALITSVTAQNKSGEVIKSIPKVLLDSDGDGFIDNQDNCPSDYQGDQSDDDHDGIGDVCDDDMQDEDGDGFYAGFDNCPGVSNPDQTDSAGFGIGDACNPAYTTDDDGDGICNAEDNCPQTYNPDQLNTDEIDGGDACSEIQ